MMGIEPPKGTFVAASMTAQIAAETGRATDQLLKELGFRPEQWIEAHQLVASHGRRAGQLIVDKIQAALRTGDESTADHYDRVLKLIELRKRYGAPAARSRGSVAPVKRVLPARSEDMTEERDLMPPEAA